MTWVEERIIGGDLDGGMMYFSEDLEPPATRFHRLGCRFVYERATLLETGERVWVPMPTAEGPPA